MVEATVRDAAQMYEEINVELATSALKEVIAWARSKKATGVAIKKGVGLSLRSRYGIRMSIKTLAGNPGWIGAGSMDKTMAKT